MLASPQVRTAMRQLLDRELPPLGLLVFVVGSASLGAEIAASGPLPVQRAVGYVVDVLAALADAGYTDVRVYAGGKADWTEAGMPLVR